MDDLQRNKSYDWFKVAMQYLIATEFLLDIICKNKNEHLYFGKQISDKFSNKKLESNDLGFFCPVMFNFYHSLEVIYKGLASLHGKNVKRIHILSNLFFRGVQKINTISNEDKKMLYCYADTIKNKFPDFNDWLVSNKLTIDNFYEFLKYPESKNGTRFLEFNFLGKEKNTLPFYKNLRKDVITIRKFIVKHYYESTGEER